MGEILSQITRIDNNIQNALAKVAAKGVTVSADAGSDELPGLIEQISTGVDLPELDTPGSAADLRTGKQLIDKDGNVVEGSMPTATQATPGITVSSGGLITASATQSAGYVAAGTKSATKQLTTQSAKTITPSKKYTDGGCFRAVYHRCNNGWCHPKPVHCSVRVQKASQKTVRMM